MTMLARAERVRARSDRGLAHALRALASQLGAASAAGVLAIFVGLPFADAIWPALILASAAWLAGFALRPAARGARPGLRRDVGLIAVALAAGSLAELTHAVGLPPVELFHLVLPGALVLAGSILLTLPVNPSPAGRPQAGELLQLSGYVFLLAAIARGFVIGAGLQHTLPATLSLLVLAVAGVLLARGSVELRASR
jgi:hypothetical protein